MTRGTYKTISDVGRRPSDPVSNALTILHNQLSAALAIKITVTATMNPRTGYFFPRSLDFAKTDRHLVFKYTASKHTLQSWSVERKSTAIPRHLRQHHAHAAGVGQAGEDEAGSNECGQTEKSGMDEPAECDAGHDE